MTDQVKTLFSSFDKKTQLTIASKLGKTLNKQTKKKVLDIIVEDVVNHGTQKVIGVIKVPNLRLLCEHPTIDLAKHMSEVRPRSSSRSRSPSKSDKSDSKKKEEKRC